MNSSLRNPNDPMIPDHILECFPKPVELRRGWKCELRPLDSADEQAFHEFFTAIPYTERMFIKHKVTDPEVIHRWCSEIDYGRNLPLLAIANGKIVADATLHQQLGGWKTHIGRISVLVHPEFRGLGLAKTMVLEIVDIARHLGLDKIEAEFIGQQEAAIKLFALLGFSNLARLPHYVKDMERNAHDYILMGMDLITNEDYAGMG